MSWLVTLQGAPEDEGLRGRFEAWRNADPAHAKAYALVAGVWDLPEMDVVADRLVARAEHGRAGSAPVVSEYGRPNRKLLRKAIMAAAAVALLAVGIQQYPALRLQWRADYVTATGFRDEISLPDGSRMILNTASAVALDFEGGNRSVMLLQGEAYFDVVPDPARPFRVTAVFSEVEVTGTAFSVRTEDDQDTVVLEHGHVDVALLPARTDLASLEPGESITATATALSAVRKTDPATSLAWLHGRLVFEDQPFGRVIDEIGRYYGYPVIVANGRLGRVKISGNYRLDNPEGVIRSLATAAGASVTRIPGGILLLR
ncbi:FecR family protein [Pseudochelatococcus sp. B33]